ncbi:MAG TPA: EAL domain-containing protein [Gammaproteobacteria bacterium]|nr:EAL domain-containing protein [Gammaproteobacteria bacterium]
MKNDIIAKKGRAVLRGKTSSVESEGQFVSKLRNAINGDELSLHYQPRFDIVQGKADVLEALVRWYEPGVGLFHPEVFIGPAEENGLIFSLDLWVFEQCCKDMKQLQATVNPNVKIAVNISILTCESIYYAQKIIEISERHGVSLLDFEFEITETSQIRDIRKVIAFCDTLKSYGATFCLDDFGTGQSALVNLQMLPVSTVKINQCFVQGIGQSDRSESIICGLIRLVKELGMQTVAEGIETNEQYWFMREAGCDQLQGFLLGRPLRFMQLKTQSLKEPVIKNG